MIKIDYIIKYFQYKSYQVQELIGQSTLIIMSPEGRQLIIPRKKYYCNLFLYFHFQLNADFFELPFNWKVELYRMLMHIELNKITNGKKNN